MDMIGRIGHLHARKNKSEREIARMTGLSCNTVAKWLHGEVNGPPKYRRSEQRSTPSCRPWPGDGKIEFQSVYVSAQISVDTIIPARSRAG